MTAALSDDFPAAGSWTTDDLESLPTDGQRRELIDGVLIVSPSPSRPHQTIAGLLMAALREDCPATYDATQAIEIRMSQRRSFIPDVLVTTAEAAERSGGWCRPHEVVLAVEIVSPSSEAMDQIMKPALYAKAGIPHYWRIEIDDGLTVHTHRIDPLAEVYTETGQWTKFVDVGEPWPINLPLDRITPRFLWPVSSARAGRFPRW
ncbi:Uma2 family endonuclease [Solwaraspora sp. WMMD1047]|uniref:Uma2 family endonuclease n=1 Tax=Solwaraspora sp. WMMD1047 TaxID=3016102 RepID=UPI002416699D|nr:Uma2 family endonuclease [Solwaraspora sp. WMMD1047]MDG4828382.1 Uma2 family endonuclease [Solwaraspora sp. WMMD1047]